jgi:glycosyltransferase involved in cell wall biosynthesis
MPPLRVAHVITNLTMGGAEMMLLRLLERLDRTRVESTVISLKQLHPVGDRIAALGVPVHALGIGAVPTPRAMGRLVAHLARAGAAVVQTWMTHADLLGGLGALLAGRLPVAWGIHVGKLDRAVHGAQAIALCRVNAFLSHVVPQAIVSCSETSRREIEALGYARGRIRVIPNGFDLSLFRRDARARAAIRAELGVDDADVVIGHVSRWHPQKDHPTLIAAAARMLPRRPRVHLVLCGRGVTRENRELASLLDRWPAEARARVHVLGERADTPALMSGFDLAVSSSSYGEAFPLVIGEAMCAEVPVVATDCGDSALLVGETGAIVPIRDPAALAHALDRFVTLSPDERRARGRAARERIGARYELSAIAERYLALWHALSERRAAPGA